MFSLVFRNPSKSVLLESDEAGDEPFMLAHNLPGVVVKMPLTL